MVKVHFIAKPVGVPPCVGPSACGSHLPTRIWRLGTVYRAVQNLDEVTCRRCVKTKAYNDRLAQRMERSFIKKAVRDRVALHDPLL